MRKALGEKTSPPLDLDSDEIIEADQKTLTYAEEDWDNPKHIEVPKDMGPDLIFSMQARQSVRAGPTKKYTHYGDNFIVGMIHLNEIVEDLMGLKEI